VAAILVIFTTACSSVAELETEVPPSPTVLVPTEDTALPTSEPICQPNPPPRVPTEQELDIYTPDLTRDWVKGPEDAVITIVEYADFQCPYCAIASQNLKALLEKYPEDVRVVYRHFPLTTIHDKAKLATQAAEAAGLQGADDAFWAMHDLLYATQEEWFPLTVEDFEIWLLDQAESLGLDRAQFETDLTSEDMAFISEMGWIEGNELQIPGTPYLRINAQYEAQADPQLLEAYVELIKHEDNQFTACPPLTMNPDLTYLATIKTEKGDFVVELFPDVAPLAVNSFLYLVEQDWFDGITFHRVIPGFVAQTGDPTGTGFGNPGYSFGNEVTEEHVFDRAGLVAMANSGPDTNGSQFFITYDAIPELNGNYTIFGEVIKGMDVVESFTPRDPQAGMELPPGDTLLDITIEEQ
jgi:cyclophilin family peptidyl-prolyl cis-trans isomerase/protein-disulfide isomerase